MSEMIRIRSIKEYFQEFAVDGIGKGQPVDLVKEQTERICDSANINNLRGGNGFECATRLGRAYGSQRALGFVYTTDQESRIAESEDKALSRAVRA